jgi:hypothetical protein
MIQLDSEPCHQEGESRVDRTRKTSVKGLKYSTCIDGYISVCICLKTESKKENRHYEHACKTHQTGLNAKLFRGCPKLDALTAKVTHFRGKFCKWDDH